MDQKIFLYFAGFFFFSCDYPLFIVIKIGKAWSFQNSDWTLHICCFSLLVEANHFIFAYFSFFNKLFHTYSLYFLWPRIFLFSCIFEEENAFYGGKWYLLFFFFCRKFVQNTVVIFFLFYKQGSHLIDLCSSLCAYCVTSHDKCRVLHIQCNARISRVAYTEVCCALLWMFHDSELL